MPNTGCLCPRGDEHGHGDASGGPFAWSSGRTRPEGRKGRRRPSSDPGWNVPELPLFVQRRSWGCCGVPDQRPALAAGGEVRGQPVPDGLVARCRGPGALARLPVVGRAIREAAGASRVELGDEGAAGTAAGVRLPSGAQGRGGAGEGGGGGVVEEGGAAVRL